jgi:TPP-dependent pyruvate/acetoin dehydrogenase alpha subunit
MSEREPTPRDCAPRSLGPEEFLDLYTWMLRTRAVDDRLDSLFRQGRLPGGIFSQRGHEAIACGTAYTLEPGDVAAPMHRDLGAYLMRGMKPARIFGQAMGRLAGPSRGRDVNTHGLSDASLSLYGYVSHLPQSMPVALGAAMAFQYRREPRVAMTYAGDGSTSEGGFHETLNLASVFQAPIVFVLENNQFAYSTPTKLQFRIENIAERASGYGMPGVIVDGNDIVAVWQATRSAVDRARAGGGPTLLEFKTMRMKGHAVHDPADYVPKELLAEWERRDPILLLEQRLQKDGLLDDARREAIHSRIRGEIDVAVREAEASDFPDPGTLTDGVFAACPR